MSNTRRLWAWGLFVVLVAGVGCGGPEERKAAYTARAQQYIQDGNFPKARVALRNVLKIDPKDAEAYFLFAQVEEREKNWRNAYANYLKVTELQPEHREALIKLGKFYLEARANDKVVEVADRILSTHPGDVGGQSLKAAVQAMTGNLPAATSQAEAIVAQFPTDPDAAILLGTLYVAQQRVNDAEAVLRRALEAHPKHLDLLNNLGSILAQSGQTEKAEQIFTRVVTVEPKVFDHRVRLASFYDFSRQPEKAEGVLREAIRMEPDNEARRLALVEYLATRKSFEQGEAVLLEARRELPRSMKIRFALGKIYEMNKAGAKARSFYEELVKEEGIRPPGLEAQVRLAGMDLAEGKRDEAQRRLDLVLKENPRAADALLLQGRMALDLRDGKQAVQAFRTVLKDQPDMAEGHMLLGQAYMLTGEASLARESLEKAVLLQPRLYGARRALAGLDAAEGHRKEARSRLEGLLKEDPKDLGALGLLFDLQVADRDWNVTETTLMRLRDAGANRVMADLAEGNIHQARQEWDQAHTSFERAAAAQPDDPAPLFSLVKLDLAQGKSAAAQARLKEMLAQRADHPYAHGMLGEVLLLAGDETGAEREFREATRLTKEWLTPWLDWTTLKLGQNKPAEAIKVLQAGLTANPQSEELRMLLATTLGDQGQMDSAIQEYESILRNNPKSFVAANNLASILSDQKGDSASLERALALSRDFEKTAPNPFFLDTLGWVYFRMGQSGEALRVMRQAVAKAPDQPLLNYHLGMVYYKAGDAKDAKVYLEKAVRAGKSFAGLEQAKSVLASIKS